MSALLPPRAFLPVIHVVSFEQVARNAGIAFDNGAHGIWLISHSLPFDSLLEIYEMVRECVPDRWIGLNFLDVHPAHGGRRVDRRHEGRHPQRQLHGAAFG